VTVQAIPGALQRPGFFIRSMTSSAWVGFWTWQTAHLQQDGETIGNAPMLDDPAILDAAFVKDGDFNAPGVRRWQGEQYTAWLGDFDPQAFNNLSMFLGIFNAQKHAQWINATAWPAAQRS
jgi:hypothetical protein